MPEGICAFPGECFFGKEYIEERERFMESGGWEGKRIEDGSELGKFKCDP